MMIEVSRPVFGVRLVIVVQTEAAEKPCDRGCLHLS